jgi:hypothetical protein
MEGKAEDSQVMQGIRSKLLSIQTGKKCIV